MMLLSLSAAACRMPRVAVLRDPLTAEEHVKLGVAYEHEGRFELACREYRRALDMDHSRARLFLANATLAAGDSRKAEALYRRHLRHNPRSAEALNNLAWLYYHEDRNLEEAERLAARAVELGGADQAAFVDTLALVREARQRNATADAEEAGASETGGSR